MEKIFRSRKICSLLKEAGYFTDETGRESGFSVYKEPEHRKYEISGIKKGDHCRLAAGNFSEEEFDTFLSDSVGDYSLLRIHFHPGSHGPIVPSIWFDEDGEPEGDLYGLQNGRFFFRDAMGYDVKHIMGVAKIRGPTLTDVLLLQEKSENPLGYGQLAEVEDALKPFQESYQKLSLEESYAKSLQVGKAIKSTGHYSALLLRYRSSRPLREDLEKLTEFEFDERPVRNSSSVGN